MTPEQLAEIEQRQVESLNADAPYNPDVWTLEADRKALVAEVKQLQADAKRWHDTYQQHASAVDEFFGELLELLPGAEDEGMDAYDQIPRGIKALTADRDRARDAAVALEQENAQLIAERNRFRALAVTALALRANGARHGEWPRWDRDAETALRAGEGSDR